MLYVEPLPPEVVASASPWLLSCLACRAVNQAMGRVIRHRLDYGAIILCDERFRPEAARRQLSCWLRGLVQVYPNFGQASGSLTKFFKVGSLCSGVAAVLVPGWLRGLQ